MPAESAAACSPPPPCSCCRQRRRARSWRAWIYTTRRASPRRRTSSSSHWVMWRCVQEPASLRLKSRCTLTWTQMQSAAPALHPHEAQALRMWLLNKGKAAAAQPDAASRAQLMLQVRFESFCRFCHSDSFFGEISFCSFVFQDVDHQLDEIMTQVNAEAKPGTNHARVIGCFAIRAGSDPPTTPRGSS